MEKYTIPYQISRIFGGNLFKYAYKPLIIDKEFIPKEGPVILCGNHLHVWDQFPVICATKRTTHWMAKKEYFDSYLGPLFKLTGAICVDRKGDASISAKIALDYLNKESVVGLFPEGTRNGLKKEKIDNLYNHYVCSKSYEEFSDEMKLLNPLASQIDFLEKLYLEKRISRDEFINCLYNVHNSLENMRDNNIITEKEFDDALLLSFKFGAVSMAAKTNAAIVPFAVNGDYKIGNDNLIVRFGQPMYCHNETLEEDNIKLRNKILTLQKKNMEKSNKK